jgi:signal peptidase I
MSSEEKQKEEEKAESKPLGPPKSTVREYFESFVVTLIIAIFGMTFILQAVTVPTGSMQNTILVGDYLLVNKFIFTPGGGSLPFLPQREIQRGDIIVFKYPGNKLHPRNDSSRGIIPYQINYVKRVIGLPGEKVEFRNNQVFVNGSFFRNTV